MISLAFALLLQADDGAAGPKAPFIRYRDRRGIIGVTTTPSNVPVGATILEITSLSGPTEIELVPIPAPPSHAELVAMIEEGIKETTRDAWRSLDASMLGARKSGDSSEPLRKIDGMLLRAMFGNGLWALPLAPFLVISICLILAWRICFGLTIHAKAAVWAAFSAAALLLAHICLHKTLYQPQAKRVDFMMSLMPYYMGGDFTLKPETRQDLLDHAKFLINDASVFSAAWTFPLEAFSARSAIRQAVQEAVDGN
jgi:hypothetical protein